MSDELDEAAALEARRKANREAFPAVASIVDEFTAAFGPVKVLGGSDFATGKSFGWVPPPSPNCDACTGHDGRTGCERMDVVAHGHDMPRPDMVFCGFRMVMGRGVVDVEQKGARR